MPPASKKSKSKSSRFPVARIKKIMQMDEEVGKLASATPVMISKSLECFLQNLIDECSSSAQARGSKKITPHHLKSTITSQPNFDFLLSLVENVPDPAPGPSGDGGAKRKRTSKKKSMKDDDGYGEEDGGVPGPTDSQPKALPQIGTWKQDMEGGGGRGEGGRGMFDDYEEDEDDY